MNWFEFLGLIIALYGKNNSPDLDKIQKKGLLAVKLGQVHALRIDFLNEEKCQHLTKLYRNTIKLPSEQFHTLLASYVADDFKSQFEWIDEQAFASASIGQVHKAKLNSGKEVVIKIIKKDFKQSFIRDVKSIKQLFKLIIFFYRKLANVADPIGILSDIEEYTLSELNLLNEIEGQRILKNICETNQSKYDLSQLAFPQIYQELSNQNVLVAEYVEGKTFDELLDRGELTYQDILNLFHIHGFYMFGIGTFHGDIHPGNIILHNGKIYFVDTGAIGRVGDKFRRGLFKFFESLSVYDYDKCADYLNQMAEIEITGKAYDAYAKKFTTLYQDFTNSTVAQVSLTKKMMQTIKLGVNSGMVFEKGIFSIIRSLMYMDGMVLRCNPNAILIKDMGKFIKKSKSFL
jgi:ubiquinone biosynthesis protein